MTNHSSYRMSPRTGSPKIEMNIPATFTSPLGPHLNSSHVEALPISDVFSCGICGNRSNTTKGMLSSSATLSTWEGVGKSVKILCWQGLSWTFCPSLILLTLFLNPVIVPLSTELHNCITMNLHTINMLLALIRIKKTRKKLNTHSKGSECPLAKCSFPTPVLTPETSRKCPEWSLMQYKEFQCS